MIHLRIKKEDNVNPLIENQRALWKQGMIVTIEADDSHWPPDDPAYRFWCVHIEDINIDDPLVQEWLAENIGVDGEGNPVMNGRRVVHLDINALPPPIRNDLLANNEITVAANRLQGFRDAITIYDWGT